ncbi:hypothetical protein ACFQ07_03395, partial [Actinomadura adrarensis]
RPALRRGLDALPQARPQIPRVIVLARAALIVIVTVLMASLAAWLDVGTGLGPLSVIVLVITCVCAGVATALNSRGAPAALVPALALIVATLFFGIGLNRELNAHRLRERGVTGYCDVEERVSRGHNSPTRWRLRCPGGHSVELNSRRVPDDGRVALRYVPEGHATAR